MWNYEICHGACIALESQLAVQIALTTPSGGILGGASVLQAYLYTESASIITLARASVLTLYLYSSISNSIFQGITSEQQE